jgi:hypothetical protein
MISFHELLKNYGVDSQVVKLARHGNKEIDVLKTFKEDKERFDEYCAWQSEGKYKNVKYIAVFTPAQGTTALFIGLWSIKGFTENSKLTKKHQSLLKKHDLPENWFDVSVRYDLKLTEIMKDLSQRLVIEWGKSTLSWVQVKDKEIVQIKPKNSIDEFQSYDAIQLTFSDLKTLIKDSDSNSTWIHALESVNGIYLIKHQLDGRLYVGSAYGKKGILGRWTSYSKNGHGDNKLLKPLEPNDFEFSILELASSTISADEIIKRENRWKTRLGTREFGLNDN